MPPHEVFIEVHVLEMCRVCVMCVCDVWGLWKLGMRVWCVLCMVFECVKYVCVCICVIYV